VRRSAGIALTSSSARPSRLRRASTRAHPSRPYQCEVMRRRNRRRENILRSIGKSAEKRRGT